MAFIPKDQKPGNSSAGISATGGPMFKNEDPARDIQWSNVRDNSEAALSSASEYDCTPFGRDYEPLPLAVKPANKWPVESYADSFLDTYSVLGRGNQAPDAGEDHE